MSSPFAPPPSETPAVVPPNRTPPQSAAKTLAVWIVLVLVLWAVYQIAEAPGGAPRPREPERGLAIGWLVPLVVYGMMLLSLLVIRSKLPAKYRTGELRELPAAKPELEAAVDPTSIEIRMNGTDLSRAITLSIDDAGIYWRAEKRLLSPELELRVAWSELESVSMGRVAGPLMTWAFMVGIVALMIAPTDLRIGAASLVIGIALGLAGRNRSRGALTFATSSHALTFHSRELDTVSQDRIMAAVRERRPQILATAAKPGRGVFWLLIVEPFALIAKATKSYGWIRALMLREGATYVDDETALASTLQYRLFALWSGVMRGAGPLSVAMGASLARGPGMGFGLGFAAWVMGLAIVGKSTLLFARFSGMSVVR